MCTLYRKYGVTFIKYSIILYMEFFSLWDFSTVAMYSALRNALGLGNILFEEC